MEPHDDATPSVLAAEAGVAVRRLACCVDGGKLRAPAEMYQVLGILQLLVEDVGQLLPSVQAELEDGLLAGRLVRHAVGDEVTDTWDRVGEVGCALAHARTLALRMTKELEHSQTAMRDLTGP
ncbi:hypothetical protein VA596_46810 [Amycolatopsis sp., V23-08]|uniref:Uncharacterized protein n=1 Tax=Amycolatopsis heterodermiae TaxID=3110235 RepID=A0ABU5RLF4_9PSEU|nr:hypothetical protein [Amycolatopsis sp., V23-08]MEA5367112.1 hypothetical protein [Amycolatopsis sp., V23-08]